MSAKNVLVFGSLLNPQEKALPGDVDVMADGYLSAEQKAKIIHFAREQSGHRYTEKDIDLSVVENGVFSVGYWYGRKTPSVQWLQMNGAARIVYEPYTTLCCALKTFRRIDDLWKEARAKGVFFHVAWDGQPRWTCQGSFRSVDVDVATRASVEAALASRVRRGWTSGAACGDVVELAKALQRNPQWWPTATFGGKIETISITQDFVHTVDRSWAITQLVRDLERTKMVDTRSHYMRPEGEVL